jgi:outer membrane protein TolC
MRGTKQSATIGRSNVILVFLFLASASCSLAQVGPAGGQSQGSQANSLPLSGRAGQNGSVTAIQSPVPGTTTSINTINPTVQVQGPFAGSALSTAKMPFSGRLSLLEAVQRGIVYNLGAVGLSQAVRQAHGQSRIARSALLPNVNGAVTESVQQINLRAAGIRINLPLPGFAFPSIAGPFNFIDFRVRLSQSVADLTALNNYRSAKEVLHANEFSARDARDLVVLAVGGAYLQVIAARARVESAGAQLETANALYQQVLQKRGVGLVAQIDVNRSQVQALTQQQRLVTLQNDLAKQKINLARLTGLPPTDQYEITDAVPFSPASPMNVEDALKLAFQERADLQAAQAQIRAASHTRSAARSERLPSLSLNADYGAIGITPSQSHGTFSVVGTVRVPLWQGGRTEGDIEEADASLTQRRAELEDLRGQIEAEVRNAYLDLQAATSQVELAKKNLETTQQTLGLTRQRFEAGVTDSVEVVQSQESVAAAELDCINSVFAHNVAKLSLARSLGGAAQGLPQFLKLQ